VKDLWCAWKSKLREMKYHLCSIFENYNWKSRNLQEFPCEVQSRREVKINSDTRWKLAWMEHPSSNKIDLRHLYGGCGKNTLYYSKYVCDYVHPNKVSTTQRDSQTDTCTKLIHVRDDEAGIV